MPLYRFKVADAKQKVVETTVEGETPSAAKRRLKLRKMMILDYLGEVDLTNKASGDKLSEGSIDIYIFTEQLVPMLEADIELERSLEIIGESLESSNNKILIHELRQGLHEGKRLSQLTEERSHIFPKFYTRMVTVGEESGCLGSVMRQLLQYMRHQKQIKGQIIAAAIYPTIISIISFSVVMFMLTYIVPKFQSIFLKIKKEPQGITAFLFKTSDIITHWWYIITPTLLIITILFMVMSRQDKWAYKIDQLLLQLPIIGDVVKTSNTIILVKSLSTMIKSGMHLLPSIQITTALIPNHVIRESVGQVSSCLRRGEKLSQALNKSSYLPQSLLKMLAVGEETGKLAEMLERVSEQQEEKLQSRLKTLLSIIEPLLIVGLGLVIGVIVLSMFMAISDITRIK